MSDSTITNDAIIQAAIQGFACQDASVSEQFVSERAANGADGGAWLCLSIQTKTSDAFGVVGRRRTRTELMALGKRGPASTQQSGPKTH
jgi:hypothetical protein